MIILPRNIVSLGKTMYQIAFLSLEFSQKSVVVATVERHKIWKFRQRFKSQYISFKFETVNSPWK